MALTLWGREMLRVNTRRKREMSGPSVHGGREKLTSLRAPRTRESGRKGRGVVFLKFREGIPFYKSKIIQGERVALGDEEKRLQSRET